MGKLKKQIEAVLRRITGTSKSLKRAEHRHKTNQEIAVREHKRQQDAARAAHKAEIHNHPKSFRAEEKKALRCKHRAIKAHRRAEFFAARILEYERELGLNRRRFATKQRKSKALEERGGPKVMYDSVTVGEIPKDAEAVAGYTDGMFQTVHSLRVGWPHAHILTINVFASDINGNCLDCEPGDADVEEAPGWMNRRRHARPDAPIPTIYTSVSQIDALVRAMQSAGIDRREYRLWSAHYGDGEHICGPDTCDLTQHECDGTQWTDHALGRNLDASKLAPGFF